ncbi:A24 family peptidase [Caldalkalibacillus salinus]|uniref:A24 family peptidase n=1 Tax=Caldalkalibacillus salinus TaxID=2803787 RepID=UPI001920883D|nr:prepilin peptidase [Caldalkalibacillus salinus]
MGAYILLLLVICIAFYTDIRTNKIPNALTIGAVLAGGLFHLLSHGVSGLILATSGLLIGGGIFFILYLIGGVGAGDVKLFAGIGALGGIDFVLYCAMYSILYAAFVGVITLFFNRVHRKRMFHFILLLVTNLKQCVHHMKYTGQKKEKVHFPFMIAVMPGYLTTLYYFM